MANTYCNPSTLDKCGTCGMPYFMGTNGYTGLRVAWAPNCSTVVCHCCAYMLGVTRKAVQPARTVTRKH